jgi:hypothetical protein
MSRPPPWQIPFTAATVGAALWRIASNGNTSRPVRLSTTGFGSLAHAAQLAARREHVARAREDQRGRLAARVHPLDRALDAVVHRGRERVARLGPVDRAPREVVAALHAQERGAEVDGFGIHASGHPALGLGLRVHA